MNLKSTLQTAGFVALLACAAPALALAQNAAPATTGRTPVQQTQMSENQIKSMLRSEGYSDITNLQRMDTHYTADATRYGQDVKGLVINPVTGKVTNQQELSQDQVKTLLEDHGYSDVTNLAHSGNVYTASVMRNGTKVKLKIDDHTGMIMRQQARN